MAELLAFREKLERLESKDSMNVETTKPVLLANPASAQLP
jgi:hypothetical protein